MTQPDPQPNVRELLKEFIERLPEDATLDSLQAAVVEFENQLRARDELAVMLGLTPKELQEPLGLREWLWVRLLESRDRRAAGAVGRTTEEVRASFGLPPEPRR
jgi:hypothetical protein